MDLIDKLLKGNAEVAGRMNRLDKFMHTEEYDQLSDKEQRLMIIQYNAMQVYADVLLQRIDEIKERL
ncbi:crAss001_48 related protein [Limosilactobacillus reuteri subsp. suis]|uniref:crAss001_48 related protein n=1 Tax=Limosilactobacillus reuteri TaxID=1598 RepID=UPI0039927119